MCVSALEPTPSAFPESAESKRTALGTGDSLLHSTVQALANYIIKDALYRR